MEIMESETYEDYDDSKSGVLGGFVGGLAVAGAAYGAYKGGKFLWNKAKTWMEDRKSKKESESDSDDIIAEAEEILEGEVEDSEE